MRSRSRAVLEAPEEQLHTVEEIQQATIPAKTRNPAIGDLRTVRGADDGDTRAPGGESALCPPCYEEALTS